MAPKILTAHLVNSIATLLDEGNYVVTACQYVGISRASYYSWIDAAMREVERVDGDGHDAQAIISVATQGLTVDEMLEACPPEFNRDEWVFVVFASAVTRARAQAEARAVRAIRTAAMSGDWRAGAWYLTHAHGHKWGADAPGVDATPEAVASEAVTVDALEAKLALLMDGQG